ncbi:MAG TPA: alpha/beta hydrolase [Bryobacteraceae bacterium]|nr:alpha/beta hydrolase [Bryobacteraceae bacterium]
MKSLFLVFAALSLSAAPAYNVETDVEFSHPGNVSLKLDAHIPDGPGPFPAVILVHGGGWTVGTKTANFVKPLFPVLDQTGMAWFTIDYRLAPQHPYPAALHDVEAAVAWVKKNAKRLRVDPKRIALMGESAGAVLVNLVGAKNQAGVAAVVCFYGAIDLLDAVKPLESEPPKGGWRDFFAISDWGEATKKKLTEASPRTWLNKKTPPFLVIHGTKDAAADYEQAKLHVALFRERGIPVELYTVEDGIHGVINWEKDVRFQGYKKRMVEWLQTTLR